MRKISLYWFAALLLSLALLSITPNLLASDSLVWHQEKDRVDADIESWDTLNLLEHVAAATGWKIYLDPGAIRNISICLPEKPCTRC